jgi:hypothetical protein
VCRPYVALSTKPVDIIGSGRREAFAVAELAARAGVPTFTHVRYPLTSEPPPGSASRHGPPHAEPRPGWGIRDESIFRIELVSLQRARADHPPVP